MNTRARFPLGFTASVCFALAGAGFLCCGWRTESPSSRPAQRFEDAIERLVRLALEVHRYDRILESIHGIEEFEQSIVHELIAGRLTLREAAARCGAARAELGCPGYEEQKRMTYPGDTDEERECRRLIHAAYTLLRESLDREVVVKRLDAELEESLVSTRRSPCESPDF